MSDIIFTIIFTRKSIALFSYLWYYSYQKVLVMKRLLRIGFGLFIHSIIPILCWIILSLIEGEKDISNTFSIIYPIQFVLIILVLMFGSGANIRKEKDKVDNSTYNGIFWGTIFSIIIYSLLVIFVDNYITFFGQDVEFYRIYVIYGIVLMFLQTLFSLFIEKLYFEDKEKTANIHLIAFNLINFVFLTISALIFSNRIIPLVLTLSILLIYVVVLYFWQMKKFKITFDFLKSFRYESASIISGIFMFVIYFFGFKNAFIANPEYIVALNISGLCTDSQWDCLGAIKTVTKVDIAKNRFEYSKASKQAMLFTLIMILTSILMIIVLYFVYDVSIGILLIYALFQYVNMLLFDYYIILLIYTQIQYSPILSTTVNLIAKAIRVILSIIILSPFCTSIAQLSEGVGCFIVFIIIRFCVYKVKEGKLYIKNRDNI